MRRMARMHADLVAHVASVTSARERLHLVRVLVHAPIALLERHALHLVVRAVPLRRSARLGVRHLLSSLLHVPPHARDVASKLDELEHVLQVLEVGAVRARTRLRTRFLLVTFCLRLRRRRLRRRRLRHCVLGRLRRHAVILACPCHLCSSAPPVGEVVVRSCRGARRARRRRRRLDACRLAARAERVVGGGVVFGFSSDLGGGVVLGLGSDLHLQ